MQSDQNWTFPIISDLFDRKRWEKYKMTKIEHSKSFWTTLIGKHWDKCKMTKIGHSQSFQNTWIAKDGEKSKMIKIEHF